jgi:Conjugative transposon protein TcpC
MRDEASASARVSIRTIPLWRVRLRYELPRYLLCGLSLAGLLASARFAIDPPRPAPERTEVAAATEDLAAQGYAQLFARAYLTWEANNPEAHVRALSSFVGPGMEAGAGLQLPSGGEERVLWTQVVQQRAGAPGERVYTVAAQTDAQGLVYLSVSIARSANGGVQLAGYPAFVGAPASAPARLAGGLREVEVPALRTVVERALRNYLAASGTELAADLARGAPVSLPEQPFTLESVQQLDWSAEGGGAVLAVVQAQDERGAGYTLAYELDVSQLAGRWQVDAIQMDPET